MEQEEEQEGFIAMPVAPADGSSTVHYRSVGAQLYPDADSVSSLEAAVQGVTDLQDHIENVLGRVTSLFEDPPPTQREWLLDVLDRMRNYDACTPGFDAEVCRYLKSMSHTIQAALISIGALDD